MAKKRDWRASGMTARWKASLPKRGERTRKGLSWGRILSPVSFLLFSALIAGLPELVRADRTELLADPVQELRSRYAMDDLEVDWKMSPGLLRAVENLGPISFEWSTDLPANCPDRVVARIKSTRSAEDEPNARRREVEYLVSGQTQVYRMAYQATRTIKVGSLILDEDVELSEGWVAPSAWTTDGKDDVIGSYVRNTIAKNSFLSRADLRERPLIQKGREVRVEFRGTGLLVTGRATSRRDAWMGDSVAIRVTGAAKDCRALVTGSNLVVVERSQQ